MSDLLTHVERFELVDVDLDKEPQCEHEYHSYSSVHRGAVTHYLKTACHHRGGLRCAGVVAILAGCTEFFCDDCNALVPMVHVKI